MRRWLTAVTLAGATGLLLAGCGKPAGVDGSLVNDWAPLAAPTSFTPPSGVCQTDNFAATAHLSSFNPVDCAASHRLETVHVGTFAGAAAHRTTPPPQGSAEMRSAFAECDTAATEYLGGEWRTGRLWLGVALPSATAWTGGSRWFRCDISEMSSVEDNGDVVSRTSTVKGTLSSPSPLNLGCYGAQLSANGSTGSMPAADCRKAHNAEFVGVWKAPDISYPAKAVDWTRFYSECRTLVAHYAGVPDDGNLQYRIGVVALPNGPDEWNAGNRGVRCYLWLSGRTLTRSIKGAGTSGLPINMK
jgi:hypothetical protein